MVSLLAGLGVYVFRSGSRFATHNLLETFLTLDTEKLHVQMPSFRVCVFFLVFLVPAIESGESEKINRIQLNRNVLEND